MFLCVHRNTQKMFTYYLCSLKSTLSDDFKIDPIEKVVYNIKIMYYCNKTHSTFIRSNPTTGLHNFTNTQDFIFLRLIWRLPKRHKCDSCKEISTKVSIGVAVVPKSPFRRTPSRLIKLSQNGSQETMPASLRGFYAFGITVYFILCRV